MWKKNVLIRGIFLYDAYFFLKTPKILVFIKNALQITILKVEHCKF